MNGTMLAGLVLEDLDEQARYFDEASRIARELGDPTVLGHCVNNLGSIELNRGGYARALELFEESLSLGRESRNQDVIARACLNLGVTTLLLGDDRGARSLLRDGVSAARELGQVEGFAYGFAGLGAAFARDDPVRAARLFGRADALCEETAFTLEPLEARVRDEAKADVQASLGEEVYAAAYGEGRGLALEDALALALT